MITKKDVRMGKAIRRYRRNLDLTQEQLAEKSRLSTTYIGYIEIGQKKPSLKALHKIADSLKVKVKDLIPY